MNAVANAFGRLGQSSSSSSSGGGRVVGRAARERVPHPRGSST